MNTYLAIITTVLVITQIIRLTQNAVQLQRQKIMFETQLGQIQDVTPQDFEIQRKAYRLVVEFLEWKQKKRENCLYRSQYSNEDGKYKCGGIQTEDGDLVMMVQPDFCCGHYERRAEDGKV